MIASSRAKRCRIIHKKYQIIPYYSITDPKSVPFIEKLLKRFSLSDMKSRYKAKVTYQFIDTSQMVLRYSRMINELRPRFSMPVSRWISDRN